MPLYRPRVLALLQVPVKSDDGDLSDSVTLPVRVQSCRLSYNDHNRADTATLTLDWQDAGTDPRYIAGAIGKVYIGNADHYDVWEPDDERDLRFIGRMSKPSRHADEEGAMVVEVELLDYTSFFLLAKPFASDGVPGYDQTLDAAWRRICENVPGAEGLADSIKLRGLDNFPLIGDAVAERFRKLKKVAVNSGSDAWAIWQQCVGMCGLVSFFELDTCIVTTVTDYYTAVDPPVLVWGRNISSVSEERNNDFDRKGVGITSFDPETGKTLEALWPPVGDKRVKGKRVAAKKRNDADALRQAEKRDYFQYSGITDPQKLLDLAKRVYEERARQEMTGTVRTAEMRLATVSGSDFDLLSLRSGDVLRVEFDAEDRQTIANLPSEQDRIDYLKGRGYSEDIAKIMARNVGDLTELDASFYVKGVDIEIESDADGGSFSIEVQYCNRILLSGDAAP